MTGGPPPQIFRHGLESSRRQRLLGFCHTRAHGLDLELASFDKGRNIEVAILIESFVGGLCEDCSSFVGFGAFGCAIGGG